MWRPGPKPTQIIRTNRRQCRCVSATCQSSKDTSMCQHEPLGEFLTPKVSRRGQVQWTWEIAHQRVLCHSDPSIKLNTAMDVAALLDHTLLHEMAHTTQGG